MKKNNQYSDDCISFKIKKIAKENPSWGYRKICYWLKEEEKINVSLKKVYHLMKENDLFELKKNISIPKQLCFEVKNKVKSLVLYFK